MLVAFELVQTLQEPQLSLLVQPAQEPHLLLLTLFFLVRLVGDAKPLGLRLLRTTAVSSFTPPSLLRARTTPEASASVVGEETEHGKDPSVETGTGLGIESSSEHCRLGERGLGD